VTSDFQKQFVQAAGARLRKNLARLGGGWKVAPGGLSVWSVQPTVAMRSSMDRVAWSIVCSSDRRHRLVTLSQPTPMNSAMLAFVPTAVSGFNALLAKKLPDITIRFHSLQSSECPVYIWTVFHAKIIAILSRQQFCSNAHCSLRPLYSYVFVRRFSSDNTAS